VIVICSLCIFAVTSCCYLHRVLVVDVRRRYRRRYRREKE